VTSVDQHVGRRIRGKRRALALTQEDLANALGVDSDRIEAYERGTEPVPREQLDRLSAILGVTVDYFLPTMPPPAS
jgi:transcriptional regulator with XRE-family HTH domain